MKDILTDLTNHETLERPVARQILIELANGNFNHSQVAAFLTIFMMRNITVDELMGFRDAMLELCLFLDLKEFDAIDLCGTGGDGKDTFNISTISSFVVAGAGQKVAKHGNNGVSSICGSSNLMNYFGYQFDNDINRLKKSLELSNVCFLHAPLFHPAMKNVAPIRKDLGMKTFFNMLGPLVNPSFPSKQFVGVYSLELARLYGYLFQKENKKFIVVHSLDGYDEISLTGAFKMIDNTGEKIYFPEDLGLNQFSLSDINGGESIEESANIFLNILKGNGTKAQNQVVIANAGMALFCANQQLSIAEVIRRAEESLISGNAFQSFKKLLQANGVNFRF